MMMIELYCSIVDVSMESSNDLLYWSLKEFSSMENTHFASPEVQNSVVPIILPRTNVHYM